MKIYTQDHGYYGCIMVIAKNEIEARKLMEPVLNYRKDSPVEEHEIKEGFVYYCLGDS